MCVELRSLSAELSSSSSGRDIPLTRNVNRALHSNWICITASHTSATYGPNCTAKKKEHNSAWRDRHSVVINCVGGGIKNAFLAGGRVGSREWLSPRVAAVPLMTDSIVNGDGIRGTPRHAIRVTNEPPCGASAWRTRATRRSLGIPEECPLVASSRGLGYMETGGEATPPSAGHSSVFTEINGGWWYATRERKRKRNGPSVLSDRQGGPRSAHTSLRPRRNNVFSSDAVS